MAQVVLASEFKRYLARVQWQTRGCFVDTNLLFAADYEVHRLYDEAVELGETILSHQIPIFSNATIRSELLELKRKVLVGEALIDFLEMTRNHLPVPVSNSLRSFRTSVRDAAANGSHYFPNDGKLKKYRDLFENEIGPGSWTDFCLKFIGDKLQAEWEGQVERKGISYLDGRPSEYLTAPVEWSDAIKLIETYGIGTSDALIINIFLRSVFPFIVTADSDVAYCMMNIETDKAVVVPDSLEFPGRTLN